MADDDDLMLARMIRVPVSPPPWMPARTPMYLTRPSEGGEAIASGIIFSIRHEDRIILQRISWRMTGFRRY